MTERRGYLDKCTDEEKKRIQTMGVNAARIANSEHKRMRNTLNMLMRLPIKSGKLYDVDRLKNLSELKDKNITALDAMMVTALDKAIKGDIRFMEFVRDTTGQKPSEKVEATIDTTKVDSKKLQDFKKELEKKVVENER